MEEVKPSLLPAEIEPLLADRPGPCLSFYFPTSHRGSRTEQGAIRLKNQLAEAQRELRARGAEEEAIESLLAPLRELAADPGFWNPQEEGIALFRAPGFLRAFHLASPLAERWSAGERFFLKPLLPLVAEDHVFYVLALSQNEVRLLEGTRREVRRLNPRDLPKNLFAALGNQKTPESLTYHTASSATGALPAVYHGTGVSEGDTKKELHRFLRRVEAAMRTLLAGRATPVVLAGAEPLPSIYREISGAPRPEPVIHGNPEHLSDEELRERAWQLLAPTFHAKRNRASERIGQLSGTRRASYEVAEILPAALQGRVESLFLACDTDVWGRIDPAENVLVHAVPEAGDQELLDAAAQLSLRHGAQVYGASLQEIPGGGKLAAVFRY